VLVFLVYLYNASTHIVVLDGAHDAVDLGLPVDAAQVVDAGGEDER
jgi:hypothetical protein